VEAQSAKGKNRNSGQYNVAEDLRKVPEKRLRHKKGVVYAIKTA
jgi:hypothetical protein